MSEWLTMKEWKETGPDNGTLMLLLLNDGTRLVGKFDGFSQTWHGNDDKVIPRPIAWCDIPGVPKALAERNARISKTREVLDAEEVAELTPEALDRGEDSPPAIVGFFDQLRKEEVRPETWREKRGLD